MEMLWVYNKPEGAPGPVFNTLDEGLSALQRAWEAGKPARLQTYALWGGGDKDWFVADMTRPALTIECPLKFLQ